MSKELCKTLVSTDNQVRDAPIPFQMKHHNITVHRRTLQRAMKTHTKGAMMYRKVRIKKISDKNKKEWMEYGRDHQDKTIDNYYQYVWYSDEAHIDPGTTPGQRVLREEGTALNPENLQEMSGQKGVTLHVAAAVNWHEKSDLIFYNCSDDPPEVEVIKPPHPRRR